MYISAYQFIWLALLALAQAATYAVPSSAPGGSAALEPAPLGVS